jgi:hypothetical protein
MEPERVAGLSKEAFVARHLRENRPVVVTAAPGWQPLERWTPAALEALLGDELVQIYGSDFDLRRIARLGEYLGEDFLRPPTAGQEVPYVRWYSKFRDVEFLWADEALAQLAASWTPPDFLPTTDFVLPAAPSPRTLDARRDLFPARGLFISGAGARTALHVDPWGSDAVLCHLYGVKRWRMYAPDQRPLLCADGRFVDPDAPDLERFPRFAEAVPTFEFSIHPGEVVFVPHGWAHHVVTESPSISLTWNFVHAAAPHGFIDWSRTPVSEVDLGIARFFTGLATLEEMRAAAMVAGAAFGP